MNATTLHFSANTHEATHQEAHVRISGLMVCEAGGQYRPATADEVMGEARRVIARRVRRGASMSSPDAVKDYLRIHLGELEHEVFGVLFVDAQLRIIEFKQMFRGTLTAATVHPREIVKEALALNAAAVLLCHNHPSQGAPEPSRADEALTAALKAALSLVDVRVLDHLIVSGGDIVSFAQRGIL